MIDLELSQLATNQETHGRTLPRLEPIPVGETIYFVNEQFGVKISRGQDNFAKLTVLVQDDGFWYEPSSSNFSSYWIDDLHDVLWAVKEYLNTNLFVKTRWGYKYK